MTEPWRRLLDETDWAALSHAYGTAVDTPAHLRALTGEDAERRRKAEYHLVSAIIHQGTPWPATWAATSIVVGMLQDPSAATAIAPSREGLTAFLQEIEEALSETPEEDWHRLAEMAERGGERASEIVDWTELDPDDDLQNALYARCLLKLRELRPEIEACLRGKPA